MEARLIIPVDFAILGAEVNGGPGSAIAADIDDISA
jgi:hypothetical protein